MLAAGPLAELPTCTCDAVIEAVPTVGRFTTVANVPLAWVPVVLIANGAVALVYENAERPPRLSCVVPLRAVAAPEFTVRLPPVTAREPFRNVLVAWSGLLFASDSVSNETACDCPPRSIRLPPVLVADVWRMSAVVERGLEGPSVTVAERMVVVPVWVFAPLRAKLPVVRVRPPPPVIGPFRVSELLAAPFWAVSTVPLATEIDRAASNVVAA